MSLRLTGPLLLVGAGKMGGALLRGWLEKGIDPASIIVQDPHPAPEAAQLVERYGVRSGNQPRLKQDPAAIVFAVKPQLMDAVLPVLGPLLGSETVLISIAAGRTLASLAKYLPAHAAIVRAMPNTPASVGQGITVACANANVTAAQALTCDVLMGAVGEVIWIEDESLLDAITAVSGSGPAYVFLLAECLAEAGVEAGLEPELATRLARATVSGGGALLALSDLSTSELRENVTSPQGTTAAALEVLTSGDGLKALLTRAVKAAAKRSREMSS